MDLRDGLLPAQARCVWSGQEADGAHVALAAYRWENPHPERMILSLDVESADAALQVGVLAVTAATA